MDVRNVYLAGDPWLREHADIDDSQTIEAYGGVVDFCNSGNHPPFYAALDTEDPARNYATVNLWPVIQSYFPGGGFSVEFNAAACDMLFCGLALRPDGTFVLQGSLGRSVTLSQDLSQAINAASNPTWPHLYGVFDDDTRAVLDTWHSNHAVGMVAAEPERARRRLQYWADIARVPVVAYDSVTRGGRTVPLQYQMYGGQVPGATALGPRG